MKRKILVCSADRAERGLLEPVMKELKARDDMEADWCNLKAQEPGTGEIDRLLIDFSQKLATFHPAIVVIPTDRWEMVYPAAFAFHHGWTIAHFHAGNNPTNHPDDINRKAISTFSHIMFANMPEHKQNLIEQGEEDWRIFAVGSTAFDHIEYDDSITPTKPFGVIILHPDPTSEENTRNDWKQTVETIEKLFLQKKVNSFIWIYPNKDRNHEIILDSLLKYVRINDWPYITVYPNLPKGQYLDVLRKCDLAVGNSSSFYYELPVVNPHAELIQVGERNKGLIVPDTVTGGAKRIATILATIPLNEKLHKKWVRT